MNKLIQIIVLLAINNLSIAAPIQVDIKYLYYRNGWDNYKTLKNGSVLYREKDFIKIIFTPSQRAYVYIFAKGSSGNIYRIFPMQTFKGKIVNNFNPVLGGVDYHIPKKDKAFSLGGSPGKETLYFIVSKQPDVELESRYNQILYARSIKTQASESKTEIVASRAIEEEVLSRDITDIVYDPLPERKSSPVYEINEAGKQFTVIRDRLLSCDGCVSRVSYELR
ncbi:MAG: DUF4384 domain-containing protein [Pseudomonadota bacterium]